MKFTPWIPISRKPGDMSRYSRDDYACVASISCIHNGWVAIVGEIKIGGFSSMDEAKAKADEILKDI